MKTRELLRCALFAALTAVGAFVRIPLLHTTITLQFFFTAMAGLLLGSRLGALSQVLYVALGLAGLPLFAMGGGVGYIFHPTFGFVVGLIPAAWVIGKIGSTGATGAGSRRRTAAACLAGLATLYAVALPYLAWIVNGYLGSGVSGAALVGAYLLPYLPGDCLKVIAYASLAPRILRALRGVR